MAVTVRQKVPGRGQPWHVFIHLKGIIRSKVVGDKRDADAVASALRRKLALGELKLDEFSGEGPTAESAATPRATGKQSAPTVSEFAGRFLNEYAKVALKQNTWEGYEAVLEKHLLPEWGTRRLDEIKRADVKTLLLKKQNSGLAHGSVQNIHIVISSLFTYALELEVLAAHPAQRMGRHMKKGDRKKDVRPLTPQQASTFLAGAKEHFPKHYPMLLCAFRTGMRLGELLGLRWRDVNFSSNQIEVKRSYSHGRMDTTKSKKSRLVDMSDQLKLTMLQHRGAMEVKFNARLARLEKLGPMGERPQFDDSPVFPDADGGHMHGDNFRHRVFTKLIEKLNFPRFRIHDIRHTFASHLLGNNAPIVYAKEQLGHASITTTVDCYGHLVPNANRNEVNKLDDADAAVQQGGAKAS